MSIDTFFLKTHSLYGRKRFVELGFNAFAIVSDQYRKENFHSDILREILDPASPHGARCLFLQKFRDFLLKAASQPLRETLLENLKQLEIDDSIEVIREENKTDIAIVNNVSHWVIIIENKINGAVDMHRQLPRYFEYWTQQRKLTVKAIVYLNSGAIKYPDTTDWSPEEEKNIKSLLIPTVGFSESDPNLVNDWLEACILSTDSFDAKAVLSQYSRILIKQAGDTTMVEMKDFAQAMWNEKVPYNDLSEFVSKYPIWIAEEIKRRLDSRIAPFTTLWIYSNHIVVLDGLRKKYDEEILCSFAIDINCNASGINLSFFVRSASNKDLLNEILLKFNKGEAFRNFIEIINKFGMSVLDGWRWVKDYSLPNSQEEMDSIVNDIVNNLLAPLGEKIEAE